MTKQTKEFYAKSAADLLGLSIEDAETLVSTPEGERLIEHLIIKFAGETQIKVNLVELIADLESPNIPQEVIDNLTALIGSKGENVGRGLNIVRNTRLAVADVLKGTLKSN
ncbi:hypothetical protein ACFL3T_03500 [Patescibacteria group bacterium]